MNRCARGGRPCGLITVNTHIRGVLKRNVHPRPSNRSRFGGLGGEGRGSKNSSCFACTSEFPQNKSGHFA